MLLRHGPLSFSELLRVANVSFLAFPRDTVNPYTIHHGMKVRKGSKYIITKWYRTRKWG